MRGFYVFCRTLIFPSHWFSDMLSGLNGKILSIGCGYGVIESKLAIDHPDLDFLCFDINTQKILHALKTYKNIKNIKFLVADATKWHSEQKYNCVVLIDLLHHLDDGKQLALLDNVWSALLAGGSLIIKEVDVR